VTRERHVEGAGRVTAVSAIIVTTKERTMVHVALLARLEAKPGKEDEVAALLTNALPLANAEPATTVWFALKLGPTTFGIFDAFPDEAGRTAHLAGQIAAALMAKAPELLARAPTIEPVDILAAKLSH
jgi:quinol monooxygenase YgiN